jgi:hypothetical protein
MAERKLELHKETLRSLTDADLNEVSGGTKEDITTVLTMTQTPLCPSGATWFASCDYEDQ